MDPWSYKVAGICFNFNGAILMVYFSIKTRGLTTNADILHNKLYRYQYVGVILLAGGFALQIFGYLLELFAP